MTTITDVNGQDFRVSTYYRGGKRVVLTLDPGRPSERDVVLDTSGTRDLIKALTDAL